MFKETLGKDLTKFQHLQSAAALSGRPITNFGLALLFLLIICRRIFSRCFRPLCWWLIDANFRFFLLWRWRRLLSGWRCWLWRGAANGVYHGNLCFGLLQG